MRSMFEAVLVTLSLAGGALAQTGEEAKPQQPATPPAQERASDQDRADVKEAPAVLKVGDTVPADVALIDTDGKAFTFGDVRGKVAVIHFWSTICPAEKAAEPKLMQLTDDLADKNVVVLAINANQPEIGARPTAEQFETKDAAAHPYAKLRAKAEQVKFNHRILVDHGATVAKLLEAKCTPHCFVIDAKGVLVYSGALDDNMRGDAKTQYLRDATEAALAGKPVEPTTTKPYG